MDNKYASINLNIHGTGQSPKLEINESSRFRRILLLCKGIAIVVKSLKEDDILINLANL